MKTKFLIITVLLPYYLFASNIDKRQLDYVQNLGQWPSNIQYKSNIVNASIYVEQSKVTFDYYAMEDLLAAHEKREKVELEKGKGHLPEDTKIAAHAFNMQLLNSVSNYRTIPADRQDYYYNYFLGENESMWRSKVPLYKELLNKDVYPKIDWVLYSQETNFKYDFIVHPGGNPSLITYSYNGLDGIALQKEQLVLQTSVGQIIEQKPYAYQIIDGAIKKIDCEFILSKNEVSFKIGDYNKMFDLIIDPVLVMATFSGARSMIFGNCAAYDASKNTYSGGEAFGPLYPITVGSYDVSYNGSVDVVINKYSAIGTSLLYATFVGGTNTEVPMTMICDKTEHLYVAGLSSSINFPRFPTSFDTLNNANFLIRLNPTGSVLNGVTRFRGSIIRDMTIGQDNNILICGDATTLLATTAGAYRTAIVGAFDDGFVAKFDSTLSTLIFSTFIGGTSEESSLSVIVNSSNQVIVGGITNSVDFPTHIGAFHTADSINSSRVSNTITILNPTASSLIYSTLFNINKAQSSNFIDLDPDGNIMALVGAIDTLVPDSGLFVIRRARSNASLYKLSSDLDSVLLKTYFSNNINISSFNVDKCGRIYIASTSVSGGLPTTTTLYGIAGSFYILQLERDARALLFATYYGAGGEHFHGYNCKFDDEGNVYQAFCNGNPATMTTPLAPYRTMTAPAFDVFTLKFIASTLYTFSTVSLCNTDSFMFHGVAIRTAGSYSDTFPAIAGCDSIHTIFVTISNVFFNNQRTCDGAPYTINAHTYIFTGTYYDTIPRAGTCDSIVITNLTVNPSVRSYMDTTVCAGQRIRFGGINRTATGVYTATFIAYSGCDSIVELDLTVLTPSSITVNLLLCASDSAFLARRWRHVAGTYRDTVDNINGCDSIWITTNLSFISVIRDTQSVSVCLGASYLCGGALQNTSGMYFDTLQTFNFCDSILITHLTILPIITDTQQVQICYNTSYYCAGAYQNTSGIFYDSLSNGSGCDSLLVTILSIESLITDTLHVNICLGSSYYCGGSLQNSNGFYLDTLIASNACDSLLFTVLTITPIIMDTANVQICMGTSHYCAGADQNSNGIYFDTLITSSGCDSLFVTVLSVAAILIDTQYVNICLGSSYFCGGQLQTSSGIYYDSLVTSVGCDSLLVSVLSIDPIISATRLVNICLGTSFYCGAALQNTTGTYYDTFFTSTGCDSLLITLLTINPIITYTENVTLCQGNSHFCAGAWQYTSGTFYDSFTTAIGCDSLLITNLSFNPILVATQNIELCMGASFYCGGALQYASGVYYDTLSNASACDSLLITNLFVHPFLYDSAYYEGCQGDSFFLFGAYRYSSTILSDTFQNSVGCDSIFTAQLVIHSLPTVAITINDTFIYIGQQIQLLTDKDSAAGSINWYSGTSIICSACPALVYQAPLSANYLVVYIDTNNCTSTDTVHIDVLESCGKSSLDIPNFISPNADGANDLFYIKNPENVPISLMRIFDRWGAMIYESTEANPSWNGTYQGRLCNPGVYVYFVKYYCPDSGSAIISGNISLIK